MKNKKRPIYDWNPETGCAVCILTDGEQVFTGMATCHPEDMDMASEKTGLEIAEMRAEINYLRHMRDNVLRPKLKILISLQKEIEHSKEYNPNSNENLILQRKIRQTSFDLAAVKDELAMVKENLIQYLARKEEFYKKIRSNRKKAESNQEE